MINETIFFIGPQGSGKGTQAKRLAARLGFFYWEMGAIIRQTAEEDTPLGREIKELIDRGTLLHDPLLLQVVGQHLDEIPHDKGLIFDGIPRRLGQAEFLMGHLKAQGRTKFTTIFIDVPHDDSIERLVSRSKVEGRADDTPAAIEFRLEQYNRDTVPVLDYLRERTTFVEIDGHPPIEIVEAAIHKALGL